MEKDILEPESAGFGGRRAVEAGWSWPRPEFPLGWVGGWEEVEASPTRSLPLLWARAAVCLWGVP